MPLIVFLVECLSFGYARFSTVCAGAENNINISLPDKDLIPSSSELEGHSPVSMTTVAFTHLASSQAYAWISLCWYVDAHLFQQGVNKFCLQCCKHPYFLHLQDENFDVSVWKVLLKQHITKMSILQLHILLVAVYVCPISVTFCNDEVCNQLGFPWQEVLSRLCLDDSWMVPARMVECW